MSEIVPEQPIPNEVALQAGLRSVWDDEVWCANGPDTSLEPDHRLKEVNPGEIIVLNEVMKEWS